MVVELVLALVVIAFLLRSIRVVSQAEALVVQRLGRYHATLESGLHFIIPFIDSVRAVIDLREQPIGLDPMPVITSDNVTMNIDTVVYLQVVDAARATYEVTNYRIAVERLIQTTLRNVIGEMALDETLTSREQINARLQAHLDEVTDKWGVKVNRIELRSIEPPADIREAMEKQMRAERERRATVTSAEATKQAAILRAEGEKQAVVLAAEAQKEKQRLEAEGEAAAILAVRNAQAQGLHMLKEVGIDQPVLALQAFDALVRVADGQATKLIIPSDLTNLLGSLGALQATWQGLKDSAAGNA